MTSDRTSAAGDPSDASEKFVVGVDFGTLSGRAIVARVADGHVLGSSVHEYTNGVVDTKLRGETALPPHWALQVPSDYTDVLKVAVPTAIAESGVDPEYVIGIGTDFTACTVLPTTGDGTPLCDIDEFRDRPHAYAKLWRHHAAQPQADRINSLAHKRGEPWIRRYGGKLSSEWEFAKALQVFEEDREIYDRMDHWVEAADWIVWQLTGKYTRNSCTAGYKAVRQGGRYPDEAFLAELDVGFGRFVKDKVEAPIVELGDRAGVLTNEAANWTGLKPGTPVCAGNVDAHVTAPAAQAIDPGQMLMVMGTSTCHVVSSPTLVEVPGMCGVVDGGIVPGLFGYEAGQSGVGDIFAWFVREGVSAEVAAQANREGIGIHDLLTRLAAEQRVGEHGLLALDWHSGNRSMLVNHELSGLILGMTLATRPFEIYRALMEATAFGTRRIIDGFEDAGIEITEVFAAGGLIKNEFLIQLYANVLGRPIRLIGTEQGPALGAAMHAAVAAGAFSNIRAAAEAMGRVRPTPFEPDPEATRIYDLIYAEYLLLHDHFGKGGNDVMKRLLSIRNEGVPD